MMLAVGNGLSKLRFSVNVVARHCNPSPAYCFVLATVLVLAMTCGFAPNALAMQHTSLSSPCNDGQLDQVTLSALPISTSDSLFQVKTVSTYSDGAFRQIGCFSQWLPLPPGTTIEPELLSAISDIEQNIQRKPSVETPIDSGLLSRLETALDQDTFEFTGESPSRGFSFGTIATLETKHETILAFLEQVANNLIPSSSAGPTPPRNVGFTLNLNDIPLNAGTLIGGSSVFSVDEFLNVFLEDLTITVSNGTLTGETQLNPENLMFERGAFSIDLDIGNARVRSTTTFEKDQGVTKQVLNMTAGLGQLNLHSQVTFSLNSSEFRLGASISDLAITTISTVDTFGNQSQTVELEINF